MRRFGSLCVWFQNISKSSHINFFKVIFLLFSFPCFEISHLFFKFAYCLQERRALIIGRHRAILGVNDLGLKFDKLPLKRGSIAQTYHRLRDILSRSEGR